MELTFPDYGYIASYVEGFLFGTISAIMPTVAEAAPIPGVYSGIFAIYLQNYESRYSTGDKAKNFFFYALWALYVLSAASNFINLSISLLPLPEASVSTMDNDNVQLRFTY